MTDRTTLVIPADRVATLEIPPLALDTGAPGPEWLDIPVSIWVFRRKPSIRLPFSPQVAAKARWRIRFAPYLTVGGLASMLGYVALAFGGRTPWGFPLMAAAFGTSMLSYQRVIRQMPARTRDGGLRLPEVPVEVARSWQDVNPGLTETTEPAPHWYSRRVYGFAALGLILAGILLVVIIANDGIADFYLVFVAAALLAAGLMAALKTLPPGYIRFDRRT
ncbi:hypothetical protein [Actinoplanes palleronii]|uniref:Uncharacterized protein n=1 Tax=Actinoplanes palleronii TaxID=113570 RepID=A0ABQ4BGL6_9ACTN|nr:hypothetical protein [Actinoplanes palleronii]GIE69804.1 hypothetical protein Apa02nite_059120 [Actinoplanes palleronii]